MIFIAALHIQINMITRNVIRVFSTYEFRTECGLLHLGRIYRRNSGASISMYRLQRYVVFSTSSDYIEGILGTIHSNITTRQAYRKICLHLFASCLSYQLFSRKQTKRGNHENFTDSALSHKIPNNPIPSYHYKSFLSLQTTDIFLYNT